MCSQFEQVIQEQQQAYFESLFHGMSFTELSRDNIRPTTLALTIDAEGARDRHWSLVPAWAKAARLKFSTFNARAETVQDKPAFRTAWKRSQRCVVPASAYAEWPTIDGKKQRHCVRAADARPLLFAGLWDIWHGEDEERHSFTILTVPPLPAIQWLHHRMPLMLPGTSVDTWLHGAPEECEKLLRPAELGELEVSPVGC